MANTSSRTSDFSSGLPSGYANGSTGAGSSSVGSGVLSLTAGVSPDYGGIIGPTGENFDSNYYKLLSVPATTNHFALDMTIFDATFTGWGLKILRSASTLSGPAFEGVEARSYYYTAGTPTNLGGLGLSNWTLASEPWLRLRLDSGTLYYESAADAGGSPGTWNYLHDDTGFGITVATYTPTWNPSSVAMYLTHSSALTGAVVTIDGYNTDTATASTYVRPTIVSGMSRAVHRAAHY